MRGAKPPVPPLGDVVDLPGLHARIPEAPSFLKNRAREVWQMTVGIMVAKNTFDEDCRDILGAYCIQMARFLDAEDKIESFTTRGFRNSTIIEPLILVSNHAHDRMVKLATELGLTPAARKRVTKVRSSAVRTPASEFLRGA